MNFMEFSHLLCLLQLNQALLHFPFWCDSCRQVWKPQSYSDADQNNSAEQDLLFCVTLLFPPHIRLINEWTRFFSDAKMEHFYKLVQWFGSEKTNYRLENAIQCVMWLIAVLIITGGRDLHSARGGDCGGRYTVQVSVLKCSVLFLLLNLHFCFVQHSLFFTHYSPWLDSGICREGDQLVVGPTDLGQFHKLTIGSIQRNRSGCRVLRAGQAATLALGNFDRSLLRKVRN